MLEIVGMIGFKSSSVGVGIRTIAEKEPRSHRWLH